MSILKLKSGELELNSPLVMGVLNVTPDSFSDGGKYNHLDTALEQAKRMVAAGATFIDVGGESTRPGALPVTVEEELARVIPVVESLKSLNVIVSIDTSTPEVIYAGAQAGAQLINDIRALQKKGALRAVIETGLSVCLMHMQGAPDSMQIKPNYENIIEDVVLFLSKRVEVCLKAGVEKHQLLIDPGFGFGKTVQHNYQLLNKLEALKVIGVPILVGMSRKSMLGDVLHKAPSQRISGGIATSIWAAQHGASVIRTHDVEETIDALKVLKAIKELGNE